MLQRLLERRPAQETAPTERFCPQAPTPKQAEFLELNCLEAFYGGSAGGGKSSALLMAALQQVHRPDYAALLLRRSYVDLSLPGALMDRAADWWRPTAARWRDREKTWVFPSGATVSFGYLETEFDKYRYQGAEFQFIGWDELPQFSETQYRYLLSRLRRREGSDVPLRVRGAGNPGGVGHEWVKRRFITEGESEGRIFVPARLDDNPHLDREEYRRALGQLDHVTRAQLLAGDWDILPEGGLFKRAWFQLSETAPVEGDRCRYWDLAATEAKAGTDPDWTVGLLLSRSAEGVFTVLDVVRVRESPGEVERLVRHCAEVDGRGVAIHMEQEPGAVGKSVTDRYGSQVLSGWAFYAQRTTGSKVERARPASAQAEAGRVRLLSAPWNSAFLDEVAAFPADGVHDDQVDCLSGALAALAQSAPWEFY